jgi:hypothetical protein
VAVRTSPAPATACSGELAAVAAGTAAANSAVRDPSRLQIRTSPTSTTCEIAASDCRATGPAPSTASVCGPGLASWRAATAAIAPVRAAVMSAESSTARTVNPTGSNATINPAEPPASGRRFAFTVSVGGWASAPDFRCRAAPGTCSWLDAAADPPLLASISACAAASISPGHRSSDRT